MEYQKFSCPKCGAPLRKTEEGVCSCVHCHTQWKDKQLLRAHETLVESLSKVRGEVSAALLEQRIADCNKFLTQIWEARRPLEENKPITQITHLKKNAQKIMDLSAEGSFIYNRAKFYRLVTEKEWDELNKFMESLCLKEEEKWVVKEFIQYLINTDSSKWVLGAMLLVEHTFAENDPERDRHRRAIKEAEIVVDAATFDANIDRDVFIAYSSKDIDAALKLLNKLEENEIECFFGARNLSNVGAQYEEAIYTALENCKVFVFISSRNSRTTNCDAYKLELKHVWKMDEERNGIMGDYERLACKYKKPRVEWLLDAHSSTSRYDKEVEKFFNGFTRHADIEEVINSVIELKDTVTYTMSQAVLKATQKTEEIVEAKAREEAAARKKAEEEAARKREQEEELEKRLAQRLAEIKTQEEAAARKKAEEEAKRQAALKAQAEEWFQKGKNYYFGRDVAQSYTEAVKWFKKAAEQGNVDAQFVLGLCHEKGEGITQSYTEAVKWYQKGAEQGHAGAQCNLGLCYERGWGVQQSDTEAIKWYKKAAEQGNADAKEKHEKLLKKARKEKEDATQHKRFESIERDSRQYTPAPLYMFDRKDEEVVQSVEELKKTKANIIATLKDFNISDPVIDSVEYGPTVTCYNVKIPRNISLRKVVALDKAIALSLHVDDVYMGPNYEDGVVSIEVPNKVRQFVQLGCMLTGDTFVNAKSSSLMFTMGKDVANRKVYGDISKMTHLLVAGSSGSGKSVFLGSLIISLIYKYSPEELRLILIDPKKTEFVLYNNLPHLMINEIITDVNKAVQSLNWAIGEMNRRYGLFEQMSRAGTYVVNLDEYNSHLEKNERLPKIVIIIDELADLMLAAKKDIEDRIQNLTQKARAAGIHLVVATQRPSTDVITGVIKSNLATRIAFAVATDVDSRVILDQSGAQKLLGKGDFLYTMQGVNTPVRVQSAFISSEDSQRVVSFIKSNNEAYYDESATTFINNARNKNESNRQYYCPRCGGGLEKQEDGSYRCPHCLWQSKETTRFDLFLATLNEEEREEFIEVFILKQKGKLEPIPDYQVGGDNKAFFRKLFVHLGEHRKKISDNLLAKMYQYAIHHT